tara:strand:- start:174 stop:557 length:384 start_codon:yes stop_codon:yes gene_type:complete
MERTLRIIQMAGAVVLLISTVIGFGLEAIKMFNARNIGLPDLLLLFIYLEVLGMVSSYWGSRQLRLIYPMFIALTALARLIILQKKDIEPSSLIYEAGAILLIAFAIVILRFRRSRYLGISENDDDI